MKFILPPSAFILWERHPLPLHPFRGLTQRISAKHLLFGKKINRRPAESSSARMRLTQKLVQALNEGTKKNDIAIGSSGRLRAGVGMDGKRRSGEPVTTIDLSLSFGEASSSSQGRSPGSGFILLAAPSRGFVNR
jgi:hypothetical protein